MVTNLARTDGWLSFATTFARSVRSYAGAMKQFIITFFLLPLFLISTLLASESSADSTYGSAVARKSKALCVALITATTGIAVYTTNLVNPDPSKPIFYLRSYFYRDRKELHVFLARGLGKRVMEFFNIRAELREAEPAAVFQEWDQKPDISEVLARWNEDSFRDNVLLDKTSTLDHASGFILLPRLLARFDFKLVADNTYDYVIYDVATDSTLQRGRLIVEKPIGS